jgi:hypothetical protein
MTTLTMSTLPMSTTFTAYLLGEMKCAALRLKIEANEIISIGVALNSGAISADDAINDLHAAGLLGLVAPSIRFST